MIPGNANPLLLATAADGAAAADVATKSLRFNSGDSSSLTRTPSSAGNRKTWTWSGWIKRVKFGAYDHFFGHYDTDFNPQHLIRFMDTDRLEYIDYTGSYQARRVTTAKYRDPSAWLHVVVAFDTTQATAGDRVKVYVNGVEITEFDEEVNPSQNYDGSAINNTLAHGIGRVPPSTNYFNGYLADVYFIDGSALTPTSFGAFDSNGVWQAAAYSGTFGTNGFHLKFDDASSDSALGTDSSGNSNTWTVNNITAKSPGDYDSPKHFDVVTYTGTGGPQTISSLNFAPDFVWIKHRTNGSSSHILNDAVRGANKRLSSNTTAAEEADSAYGYLSAFTSNGFTLTAGSSGDDLVCNSGDTYVAWAWSAGDNSNKTYTVKVVSDSGNKYRFDDFGTSAVTLDLAEGSTYVFDQSDSSNSGHPLRFSTTSDGTHNSGTEYTTGVTTTGTPGSAGAKTTIVVAASAPTLYYYCSSHSGMGGQANTNDTEGASNFDGTIQAKVKANQDYGFSVATYTGTGANASFGHGLGSTPKMVWIKGRDTTYDWRVHHESFSTGYDAQLNQQSAASSASTVYRAAPTSSVVNIGTGTAVNGSTDTYVAYCWSEISGFSKISTYTGSGSSQTIECGFKPKFVLLKNIDVSNDNWYIFDAKRLPNTVWTNGDNAESSSYSSYFTGFTSSGFTVTGSNQNTNKSGNTYIFMAFAGTPAGEEDDSVFDVPTNGDQSDTGAGGEVSGNYCTLNPLDNGGQTLSNGNLDIEGASGAWKTTRATVGLSSGKWYWEFLHDFSRATSTRECMVGIAKANATLTNYTGSDANGWGYYDIAGNIYNNGSGGSAIASYDNGDIIGVAFDADNGKLYFSKNGTFINSGDPAAGTGAVVTGLTSGPYFPAFAFFGTGTNSPVNFGQRAFAYSAPSGFSPICTTNLPTPTIADGSVYFNTKLWTGTQASLAITGLGFNPDLVWGKRYSTTGDNILIDSVRGVDKYLRANLTNAEATLSTIITSFDSDGFTVGSSTALNLSSASIAGWAWDAGSSTASNTDGSITSSVRVNQTAGFSIVSWTGTGSAGTIGHSLNSAPELIIGKNRGNTTSWVVGAAAANDWSKVLFLNSTAALATNGNFNNTAPTSSVFSVGTGSGLNQNTYAHIAYCFTSVANYSQFGSYEGNSSTDGPFIYTGFRPALVICKAYVAASTSVTGWVMQDSARGSFNVINAKQLYANANYAEGKRGDGSSTNPQRVDMDFLSNGFKLREIGNEINATGYSYIYMAWAENPFQANGGLAR